MMPTTFRPAVVLLVLAASPALGAPVFEPHLPDFYQHQQSHQMQWPTNPASAYPGAPDTEPNPLNPGYANGNWWEDTGGWCRTTAWANAMYHFDQLGFGGLFDHSKPPASDPVHNNKNWLQRFAYANEDLSIRAGLGCIGPSGVVDYVHDYGHRASLVEYQWDDANSKVTERTYTQGSVSGISDSSITTMYDVITTLLPDDDWAVVIEISDPDAVQWWHDPANGIESFHAFTGAGVEAAMRSLWWADPNDTEVTANAGVNWGHSYVATDPVPVGQAYYSNAMLKADKLTFDNGPYAGATIDAIYALSVVPEPTTLVLFATGLVILVSRRGRR